MQRDSTVAIYVILECSTVYYDSFRIPLLEMLKQTVRLCLGLDNCRFLACLNRADDEEVSGVTTSGRFQMIPGPLSTRAVGTAALQSFFGPQHHIGTYKCSKIEQHLNPLRWTLKWFTLSSKVHSSEIQFRAILSIVSDRSTNYYRFWVCYVIES